MSNLKRKDSLNTPKVTNVCTLYNDIYIEFENGFIAIFEPYAHGFGYNVEGLRRFHLKKDNDIICTYNDRLYYMGPQEDEHKIVALDNAYTQQQIASYWRAARDYLNKEYYNKPEKKRNLKLWYPYRIVCFEGESSLSDLEKGEAKMIGSD